MTHQTEVNLQTWLKTWQDLLKEPNKLFTSLTIANVSQYLLDELNSKNRTYPYKFDLQSYEKELLDFLIYKIRDRKNLEKKIYSKNLLYQIRRNLKRHMITKKHLELLSAYQINNVFIKRYNDLVNQLISRNQERILQFITIFLLRSLLFEYSPKFLTELPKKIFSESYFQYYEKTAVNVLINDPIILSESNQIFSKLITELEVSSQDLKFNYPKIFSISIRWNENIDYLTQYLRNKFDNKSKLLNDSLINNNLNEVKNNISLIVTNFIDIVIERISNFIIIECLDKLATSIGHGNHNPDYNFEYINSLFKKHIPSDNISFNFFISSAFFWCFVDLVNKQIKNKIKSLTQKEINIFTNELIRFLKNNIKKTKDPYFTNNFDMVIYSFDFKLLISTFNEKCLKRNIKLIKKELIEIRTLNKSITNEEYITQISTKIFENLKSEGFDFIPHYLDKTITKMLFDSFFKKFYENDQTWKVFYIINDIDCNNKVFRINDTLFYDSRSWDFGESFKFDIPVHFINLGELKGKFIEYRKYSDKERSIKFKRNSARAMISINAKDPFMAIEKGKIKLSKVIDSLVYASSARNTFGSKPRLYGHYMTLDSNFNKLLHGESIPFIDTLKINEEYNLITKSFDKFFTTDTNRFKDRLERSLSWYNNGKWNGFSHERFTGFWIALELLISTSSKKKKDSVISYVPCLTNNWKNSNQSSSIIQLINEIVKLINKDSKLIKILDDDIKLKYYKYDTGNTILSNLARLKKKMKGNDVERSINNLQSYMKKFDKNMLISNINILQKNQQFIIAKLNSLRNKIIHEGFSYSPQIDYLLIELEKMLTSLIYNILIFGYKKDINQVIKEFNKPFRCSSSRLDGYVPKLQYDIT